MLVAVSEHGDRRAEHAGENEHERAAERQGAFFIWRTAKYITTGTMDTRAKYISQSFAILAAAPPAA